MRDDNNPNSPQITLISGPLTDEQREQLANSKRVWREPIKATGQSPTSRGDAMTTPPSETLGAFLGDTAEKIAKAEMEAIVAYLRDWCVDGSGYPEEVIDRIEAGEHHAAKAGPTPWPKCEVCGGAKFYLWTTLDDDSRPIEATRVCAGCDDKVLTDPMTHATDADHGPLRKVKP